MSSPPFRFFSPRSESLGAEAIQNLLPSAEVTHVPHEEGRPEHFAIVDEASGLEAILVVEPQETAAEVAEAFRSALAEDQPEAADRLQSLNDTALVYGLLCPEEALPTDELRDLVRRLALVLDAYLQTPEAFYDPLGVLIVTLEWDDLGEDDDWGEDGDLGQDDEGPFHLNLFGARPEPLTLAEVANLFQDAEVRERDDIFVVELNDFEIELHPWPQEFVAQAIPGVRRSILDLARGTEQNMAPNLLEWVSATEQVWALMGPDVEPATPQSGEFIERATALADLLSGFIYGHGMVLSSDGPLLRPAGHPHDGKQDPDWQPSERQRRRRVRNLALLKERQVPVYDGELFVDDDEDVTLRSPQETARRVLALLASALRAEDLSLDNALAILRDESDLSPKERAFIHEDDPDPQTKQVLIWRYEAIYFLLWALGHFDELPWPTGMADMPRMMGLLQELHKEESFVDGAELRSKEELLDAQDLILRLHWAVRTCHINRDPIPGNFDWSAPDELMPVTSHPGTGVIAERHLAANWLVGAGDDLEWDDVQTAT